MRDLESAIERAVVLGDSDWIQPEDLPDTKRQLILAAWRLAGGDHDRTAERLNIHPDSLRRLIRW